ncbi:MAG: VOC family protein [Actinomycetota bacterium]|nr:VOC family protein [Actinomycetota bacterium]
MMRTESAFHTGFVVDDVEAARDHLSAHLNATWTPVEERDMPLRGPAGPVTVRLRFTYTTTGPHHLELLGAVPETVWQASGPSHPGTIAAHHIGLWCSDLAETSRRLEADGSPLLVTYDSELDEAVGFAYHRLPSGLLLELVDEARRPAFEHWFGGGPFPVGNSTTTAHGTTGRGVDR